MPKLYRQPCLERGEEEVQKGGDGSGGMWAGSPDLQSLQHLHCSFGPVLVVVQVSELGAMCMVLPVITECVGFVKGRSHGCVDDDDADDE